MIVNFKLREKLILITLVTVLAAVGTAVYFNLRDFIRVYEGSIKDRVSAEAHRLNHTITDVIDLGLSLGELKGLSAECRHIVEVIPHGKYCLIMDNEGKVHYHNLPEKKGLILNDEISLKALKAEEALVQRYRLDSGENIYDFTVPIWTDETSGKRVGIIRVGVLSSIVDDEVSLLVKHALWSGLFFSIIAGMGVFLLINVNILRPIRQVISGISKFGRGELDYKINLKGRDEFSELANSFNQMAGDLKDKELRVKNRTSELTILNEMSNAISYSFDSQQVLELAMESLLKAIDYDICAALLLDGQTANILIKPVYSQSFKYADQTKERLLKEIATFRNEDIHDDQVNVTTLQVGSNIHPEDKRSFGDLKLSFFAPLLVKGKIIGIINVASAREGIFDEDEAKFVNTVANQVSNAIERLQMLASAEKSKMESMVEGMLEGAIMLDEKGDIVVLNPRAREMMGFNPEGKVIRVNLYEQMKLVNLDITLEECIRKNEVVGREIIMPHNEWRILQCTVSPVRSGNERVGTAIILRDITREKEVDSMKTEFISTVSHELRTPLSITKEGLSLILDRVAGDITEKQEMILSTAKENMDRLGRLINNVLDISKIEAGKMEARREQLNIVELAKHVVSTFEMKVAGNDLELRTNFSEEVIDVFADHDKIIQVFTNLINNAIKFTPSGHIEISGKVEGDYVECAVTDTGIGISKDNLLRTFVKFQQFGRVPGSGEKGTGLGLSIAKGIVEMHNGKIRVESEFGVGTKFIFTLPKFEPELPLKEFVGGGIKIAQKSNARMSLIAIKMFEGKSSKEPFSKDQREVYLKGIEAVLKEDLHRDGDGVFRDTDRCFVTLTNCSKDHISSVCDRLRSTLHTHLTHAELTDVVAVKIECATYPDDASDNVGLLEKVSNV